MKERPIIFIGQMVRAILDGRKTKTRRAISKNTIINCTGFDDDGWPTTENKYGDTCRLACPYGKPGDRLWVRETWCTYPWHDRLKPSEIPHYEDLFIMHDENDINYRATPTENYNSGKWRPSIYMPRWASRINLVVTGVIVERVQDISTTDCLAEGVEEPASNYESAQDQFDPGLSPRDVFRDLWSSINVIRGYSWESNPLVWVVEFENY